MCAAKTFNHPVTIIISFVKKVTRYKGPFVIVINRNLMWWALWVGVIEEDNALIYIKIGLLKRKGILKLSLESKWNLHST